MKQTVTVAAMLMAGIIPMQVEAENLGVKAQTYQLDRDGREQIKDIIRQKEASGEIRRFWEDYRNKTIAAIKNPPPLGIKSDFAPRSEIHEAKFVLPFDYRNEKGQVVAHRGTVIEPLKIMPLTSRLIFIDGRDERQIRYAIARGRTTPLKIVLTAGSPYSLRVQYQNVDWRGGKGVPFYFDQRKAIIQTLKRLYGIDIRSVPAVLAQKGDKLSVEFGMGAMQ